MRSEDTELFDAICSREGCPYSIVGKVKENSEKFKKMTVCVKREKRMGVTGKIRKLNVTVIFF